jgi:endonuclease/exonuclease/phosphatase (EEP) superfamily protein YafD
MQKFSHTNLLGIILWATIFILLGLSLSTAWWYKFWVFEILGTAYLWVASATLLLFNILLLIKSLRRKRRLLVVLAIALIFYAQSILAWYGPNSGQPQSSRIPVTVMTYNVNYQLWNTSAVEQLVRANPADIFGLVEPYKEQAADLRKRVQDIYPHYYRATGGNLSLFSRYRMIEARTDNLNSLHQSLFATLDIQGRPVQVIVLRPPAPQTIDHFNRRNQVLRSLADYAKQQSSSLIVMGDFNTTSWSFYLHEFVQRSGLYSAALGHGLHPTWYYGTHTKVFASTHWLFQFIKIPIDHIFLSKDIQVDQIIAGSSGVSDHRALIGKIRV